MLLVKRSLFCLVALLAISGCSVKRNNIVSTNYHGILVHYNLYFNARERMKQGAASLATAHEDKYDRVLSIFKYGNLNQAKSVFPDMDEAIKKASIAITRHSMELKSKKDSKVAERNKWIDDCYLLIGKSQFYKQDYWTAIETFQYTSSEYKTTPSRPEALLWLSKTYLGLGKNTDAEYLLDFLKNDKDFPLALKGEYNATLAHYHYLRNDVPRTVTALKSAVATTKKKDSRARYLFILAQLYQKQGILDSAFINYEKVIKLNPSYEMAFNARINRARCYDVNSGKGQDVKKELAKMLKDEKNKEYQDQIYYALAGIARQEKNEGSAIDYLNKSLRASSGNDVQKGLTYLELTDIYYNQPDYIPAAAYCDSALTFMSNDHPDYADLQAKRNSLDRLVKNLKVIIAEDSLQALSKLSSTDLAAKVDDIIKKEDEEKERLKKEKETQQKLEELQILEEKELKSQPRNTSGSNLATAQGSWYFYNQSSISFGYNEFLTKWGRRRLEDNWRRAEKEITLVEEVANEVQDSTKAKPGVNLDSLSKLDSKARREAYINLLPANETAIAESNSRLIEAYYNVAVIYREQLNNMPLSVKYFEELDTRFPSNKFKQPSYYNLYRTYGYMSDSVKADYYKNYLLTNYPESEYSKLILNPNFFKDLKKKTAVLEVFYENTYRAYLNAQYEDVIERKTMSDSLFPNSKLKPKFTFLKALAIGRMKSETEFQVALEEVVQNFSKDSVADRAKQILAFIKAKSLSPSNDSLANKNALNAKVDSIFYKFQPNTQQYFVLLFKKRSLKAEDIMSKIRAYNTVNYQAKNLLVTSGTLDLENDYISVISFQNTNEALQYYRSIVTEEGLINNLNPNEVDFFVITRDNLAQLAKTSKVRDYAAFFKENYLQ